MIRSLYERPVFIADRLVGTPLLLVAGIGEDAFGYQTTILETVASGKFLLPFHESSLMLERVRMRGECEVRVMTAQDLWYTGCLTPHRMVNSYLVLEVLKAADKPVENYLLPQT